MTSQRKLQTNRANSQKSSGPRTTEGKRTASGNSRKHGFAGSNWQQLAGSAEVEELAKALCADQQDPALLVQAHIIAQNEGVRRAIRLHKLSLLERQMTQSERDHSKEVIGKLFIRLFDRFRQNLPTAVSLRQPYSLESILGGIEEYFEGDDLVALRKFVKEFLDQQPERPPQVDECKAWELAAPEIDRLARYEARGWTRQMRAIRNFIEICRSAE